MEISIGDVLRYKKPACDQNMYEDGHLNFHFLTHESKAAAKLQLEKGINASAAISTLEEGKVRPVILVSSSPNKKGSAETPWEDYFDVDNGHIRYFGDNKEPGKDPATAPGNKALLEAFRLAHSHDPKLRLTTPPIVFFQRVSVNGNPKGFPKFMGFGVISSVDLVTQWDNDKQRSFTNYAFDFTVLSLAAEHETFDFSWINHRRHAGFSLQETNAMAPKSWQTWLKFGSNALNNLRRRVSKLKVVKTDEQRPLPGTSQHHTLQAVYDFYANKKHNFEALAELITERVIGQELGVYRKGWVTQGSSDGGADFVGKVVLGSGFSKVELIVLGQAKCEKLDSPTGGNHIARTVARLKRGWLGAYVTTSYFSESVQREVLEDDYPIVLIHGKRIAEELEQMLHQSTTANTLLELLHEVDADYPDRIRARRPEEVLD